MTENLLANVTCVSIEGRGLLIEGPPGSGKSSLALSLIDRGATLVGDDGVLLEQRGDRLWISPPPRITGKLEIRGVGVVEYPVASAPLAIVLTLTETCPRVPETVMRTIAGQSLPSLPFRPGDPNQALRAQWALSRFGLS